MSLGPPLKRSRTTPWLYNVEDQTVRFRVLSKEPENAEDGWMYWDDGSNRFDGNAGLRIHRDGRWDDVYSAYGPGDLDLSSLTVGTIFMDPAYGPLPAGLDGEIALADYSVTADPAPALNFYRGLQWEQVVTTSSANGTNMLDPRVEGILAFNTLSTSAPTVAPYLSQGAQGIVYFDNGTNTISGFRTLRLYNGAEWVDLVLNDPTNGCVMQEAKLLDTVQFQDKRSAAPSTPLDGMVYYDDGNNTCSGAPNLKLYATSDFLDIPVQKCGELTTGVLTPTGGSTNTKWCRCAWARTGAQVTFSIYLEYDSHSGTGAMTLVNAIPYQAKAGVSGTMLYGLSVPTADCFVGGTGVQMGARINGGSSIITLFTYNMETGAPMTFVQGSQLQTAGLFYIVGTYITDDAF